MYGCSCYDRFTIITITITIINSPVSFHLFAPIPLYRIPWALRTVSPKRMAVSKIDSTIDSSCSNCGCDLQTPGRKDKWGCYDPWIVWYSDILDIVVHCSEMMLKLCLNNAIDPSFGCSFPSTNICDYLQIYTIYITVYSCEIGVSYDCTCIFRQTSFFQSHTAKQNHHKTS